MGLLHGLNSILDNRERLKTEEVHLDETRILNHRALILCYEHLLARLLVISRTYGNPIGNVITTDNRTAGVYTRTAHVTLQHLRILNRIAHDGVGRLLGSLQLRNYHYGVIEVYLELLILVVRVGDAVRNPLAELVGLRQW